MFSVSMGDDEAHTSCQSLLTSAIDMSLLDEHLDVCLVSSGIVPVEFGSSCDVEDGTCRVFEENIAIEYKRVPSSSSLQDACDVYIDESQLVCRDGATETDRLDGILNAQVKHKPVVEAMMVNDANLVIHEQFKAHPECILDPTFVEEVHSWLLQYPKDSQHDSINVISMTSLYHVATPGVYEGLVAACTTELDRLSKQGKCVANVVQQLVLRSSWILYDILLLYNLYQQHLQALTAFTFSAEQKNAGPLKLMTADMKIQQQTYYAKSAQLGMKLNKHTPQSKSVWEYILEFGETQKCTQTKHSCHACSINSYFKDLPIDTVQKYAIVNIADRRSQMHKLHTCNGIVFNNKSIDSLKCTDIIPQLNPIPVDQWKEVCIWLETYFECLQKVFPWFAQIVKKHPSTKKSTTYKEEQMYLPLPQIDALSEIDKGNLKQFRSLGQSTKQNEIYTEWNTHLKHTSKSDIHQNIAYNGSRSVEQQRHSVMELSRDIHILQTLKTKYQVDQNLKMTEQEQDMCTLEGTSETLQDGKVVWGGYSRQPVQISKKRKGDTTTSIELEQVCLLAEESVICVDAVNQLKRAQSISSLCSVDTNDANKKSMNNQNTNDNAIDLASDPMLQHTTEDVLDPNNDDDNDTYAYYDDNISIDTEERLVLPVQASDQLTEIQSPPPLEHVNPSIYLDTPKSPSTCISSPTDNVLHQSISTSTVSIGGLSHFLQTLQPQLPNTPIASTEDYQLLEECILRMELDEKEALLRKFGLHANATNVNQLLLKCILWDSRNPTQTQTSRNISLEPPKIQRQSVHLHSANSKKVPSTVINDAIPHIFTCWTCAITNWQYLPQQSNLLEYIVSMQSLNCSTLYTLITDTNNNNTSSTLLDLFVKPVCFSATIFTKCKTSMKSLIPIYLQLQEVYFPSVYLESKDLVTEKESYLDQYIDGLQLQWVYNVEMLLVPVLFKIANIQIPIDSYLHIHQQQSQIGSLEPLDDKALLKQWMQFITITNKYSPLQCKSIQQAKQPKKTFLTYLEQYSIPYHGNIPL